MGLFERSELPLALSVTRFSSFSAKHVLFYKSISYKVSHEISYVSFESFGFDPVELSNRLVEAPSRHPGSWSVSGDLRHIKAARTRRVRFVAPRGSLNSCGAKDVTIEKKYGIIGSRVPGSEFTKTLSLGSWMEDDESTWENM